MSRTSKGSSAAHLVVAKAYVDQLSRSQAVPPDRITALQKPSKRGEFAHEQSKLAKLKRMAPSFEKTRHGETPADSLRLHALAEVLMQLSS